MSILPKLIHQFVALYLLVATYLEGGNSCNSAPCCETQRD